MLAMPSRNPTRSRSLRRGRWWEEGFGGAVPQAAGCSTLNGGPMRPYLSRTANLLVNTVMKPCFDKLVGSSVAGCRHGASLRPQAVCPVGLPLSARRSVGRHRQCHKGSRVRIGARSTGGVQGLGCILRILSDAACPVPRSAPRPLPGFFACNLDQEAGCFG